MFNLSLKSKLFSESKEKHFFIFLFLISFSFSGLLAQEFDPASVTPKGCGDGKFDCGFKSEAPEALIAIPLSPSSRISHRGLPSSFDLSSRMPPVGNQGRQGSCVAWATTYAIKSYHEKIERNFNYDIRWTTVREPAGNGMYYLVPQAEGSMNNVFSPAFVYNQINKGVDQGSFIGDALDLLVNRGAPPYSLMPYNVKDFRTQPNSRQFQEAAKYKARRWYRIEPTNTNAIKAELAKGNPVVFGMRIERAFHNVKTEVYDTPGNGTMGGHAMTLVGYDDNKRSPKGHQGAYRLINSWGESWGDKGYGWVSYRVFAAFTHSAYVLEDIQESVNPPVQEEGIAPPATVEATKGTHPSSVVISWTPVNEASGYFVYKYVGQSENHSHYFYSTATTYTDSNVQVNLTYRYRVVTVVGSGDDIVYSDLSKSPIAEGYAKEQTDSFPGKVSGVTVTLNENNQVLINWNAIPNARSYEIFKYFVATKDWRRLGTSNNTRTQDNAPVRGNNNFYAVRAVNAGGVGPWSEPEGVFVANTTQNTKPAVVQNLSASRGRAGGIDVTWRASASATRYFLYRYSVSSRRWDNGTPLNTTSFRDNSREATSGNLIGYTVFASNNSGNSDQSVVVYGLGVSSNFYQRGNIVLPPENINSEIKGNQLSINWDSVPGAEEYYVFLRKPNSKKWEFLASTGSQLKYTYTVPSTNEMYSLAVKAKAAMGGESILSKIVIGYVTEEKKGVRHRFLPEAGIQNFVGLWSGSYMDGKSAPKDLSLEITNDGNKFTAKLTEQGKKPRIYRGTYAANSNFLETKDFYLESRSTLGKLSDVVNLKLNNSNLSKSSLDLGFMRVD